MLSALRPQQTTGTLTTWRFLSTFGQIDDPLDLVLHSNQRILSSTGSSLSVLCNADTTTFAKAQDLLVFLPASESAAILHLALLIGHERLSVEILGVRVLSDQLSNLDAGDEIFVSLRHEVVIFGLEE